MRRIAIGLFAAFWLFYVLHLASNIVREVYLAVSIGDHLSSDVSAYLGLHPDLFEVRGRGAFINNNPGASMVGAVPYALARPAIDRIVARSQKMRAGTPGARPQEYRTPNLKDLAFYRQAWQRGLDVKLGLAAGVMQAFAMAPLSALSVAVMFYLLARRAMSLRAAAALAALYGVATPVFYRTAQLNQNLLVGHCAFFAFALLWRPGVDLPGPRRRSYLLAGLLTGWALVCDYSGLVAAAFVTAYAVARSSAPGAAGATGNLALFAAGAALSASVLPWYQWVSFGHPLRPAQYYMPTTPFSGLGRAGITEPQLDLFWDTVFGARFGLFTSAPVLLLALAPAAWLSRRVRLVAGVEAWCVGLYVLAFFVFASAVQYGRLQHLTGVRYLVPVSPFLFLIAAGMLLRMRPWAAIAFGVVTAYWSWCLAMYRDVERGLGIPESIIHVSLHGPRLPWLTTLERMGYVEPGFAVPLLTLFALFVFLLWHFGGYRRVEWSRAGGGRVGP